MIRYPHSLLPNLCRAALWGVLASLMWGPDRPAHAEWSAVAEQKTSYTSDAFQFSSARRLRLTEDPSQPTVVSSEKPEDVIWEPALEVVHSTPTAQGKNELSVKAQGAIYTNNPIKERFAIVKTCKAVRFPTCEILTDDLKNFIVPRALKLKGM